jgi:hypothetical protein
MPSRYLAAIIGILTLAACTSTSALPPSAESSSVVTPASSSRSISGWPPPTSKFTPSPPGHYPGKVLLAEKGYFRFNYPPDWTVDRLNPDNIAVYAPPGIPGQSPAFLHSNILSLPTGTTLEGFKKIMLKGGNKYTVLGVTKGRLSGLPSYTVTSVPVNIPEWKSQVAFCVWHDIGYEVGYTAQLSDWKANLAAFSLELRSFRVTKK